MTGARGRKITQLQYHRQMHLTHPRMWELDRLGQEAMVDAFVRVESERLNWIRDNQATLRVGSREELARKLGEDAPDGPGGTPSIGREIILLPATHTNSPRQLRSLYHDAMRIVAAKGPPTLFITFTCNPKWPEITGAMAEEEKQREKEAGGSGAPKQKDPFRPTS